MTTNAVKKTASNLTEMTLCEAKQGLLRKDFSAQELTQAFLERMEDTRPLNAYITETPEVALAQAAESDKRIAAGQARAMEGMPIGMKDLFCTEGTKTTAASRILSNFVPPYESTVSGNLWNAGAVMLGKTNMDEFAMGSANTTSHFGAVVNPWKSSDQKDLTPGGSSGGSSSCVASGSALAATATDTGGSIRQPAAFTGTVGLKPTYGRCSRYGMMAFASSLDQAGTITHNVEDAALMMGCMAGHDPKDATSSSVAVPDFTQALTGDVKGLRIGIPKEYRVEGMDPAIIKMWDKAAEDLRHAGAEIIDVSLPHTKYSLPTYYVLAPAEASSNLARYDGVRYGMRESGDSLDELYENTRTAGFGEEVKRRIMIGTYVLSAGFYDAYYLKAQKVRSLVAQDFKNVFESVDVLLTPTTPTSAFALDEKPSDPVTMYMNDVLTVPVNLAGLPAISIPGGLDDKGLPLGLQLIGKAFDEATILRTAQVLESAVQFKTFLERVHG